MRNIWLVAIMVAGPAQAAVEHATGDFEVKVEPITSDNAAGITVGRHLLTKTFAGGLTATSRGEMQTATGPVETSAAYVLIERVTGTLAGRDGGFVLAHLGTLDRGTPVQRVAVVPDSGTGALAGIKGAMTIRIAGGKHFYDLAYELPSK